MRTWSTGRAHRRTDTRRWALCAAVALTAQASAGVRFHQDPRAAVSAARKADLPLMIYVIDRSRNVNSEERRRINRVFRDPAVERAAQRFVCVQLNSARYPDELRRWGLSPRTNFQLVFASPTGKRIRSGGVGSVEAVLREMGAAWEDYREAVFHDVIQPALASRSLRMTQARAALRRVRSLDIRIADQVVLDLLARPGVSDLRPEVYRTLAAISTPRAMRTLLRSAARDQEAAAALRYCNPLATEPLLEAMADPDLGLRQYAYDALVRIAKIPNPKPASFWNKASRRARRAEIARVRQLARKHAGHWQRDAPEQR